MNIVMGKALEVFEKTCKKGKACGNACISALKNCASKKTGESTTQSTKKTGESTKKTGESTKKTGESTKKTGESTKKTGESTKKTGESTKKTGESTKKTRGSTKKTGESTTQSTKKTGESTQPTKTTPVSYKADSSDHKALMNIGKDFSDQTMGKAVKAYEDAIDETKNFFADIERNNKKTKKGEWFKKDEKHAAKLQEKTELAEKEFEAAAEEVLQKLKAHHKINREDAEKWANSLVSDKFTLTGKDRETTLTALADVYMTTGGMGTTELKKVINTDTARAYANPYTGELTLGSKGITFGDRELALDSESSLSNRRGVTFHEYAHFSEFENKQLAVASRKFIEDRATSPEIMKLNDVYKKKYDIDEYNGFEDNEMALPGNFIHPYVGKIYGPAGTWTEVVSMGVESFVNSEQMASFYRRDPGHFNFILGAILHEN
jgi:hypothetical protein